MSEILEWVRGQDNFYPSKTYSHYDAGPAIFFTDRKHDYEIVGLDNGKFMILMDDEIVSRTYVKSSKNPAKEVIQDFINATGYVPNELESVEESRRFPRRRRIVEESVELDKEGVVSEILKADAVDVDGTVISPIENDEGYDDMDIPVISFYTSSESDYPILEFSMNDLDDAKIMEGALMVLGSRVTLLKKNTI